MPYGGVSNPESSVAKDYVERVKAIREVPLEELVTLITPDEARKIDAYQRRSSVQMLGDYPVPTQFEHSDRRAAALALIGNRASYDDAIEDALDGDETIQRIRQYTDYEKAIPSLRARRSVFVAILEMYNQGMVIEPETTVDPIVSPDEISGTAA